MISTISFKISFKIDSTMPFNKISVKSCSQNTGRLSQNDFDTQTFRTDYIELAPMCDVHTCGSGLLSGQDQMQRMCYGQQSDDFRIQDRGVSHGEKLKVVSFELFGPCDREPIASPAPVERVFV